MMPPKQLCCCYCCRAVVARIPSPRRIKYIYSRMFCHTVNYCSGVPEGAYPDLQMAHRRCGSFKYLRALTTPRKNDETKKGTPRGFNFVQPLHRKNRYKPVIGSNRFCPAVLYPMKPFFFVCGSNASQAVVGPWTFHASAHLYARHVVYGW